MTNRMDIANNLPEYKRLKGYLRIFGNF